MLTCLFDYIGLKGVTPSTSGTFINQLQGIETSYLDQIRKEETYDIEDAWDDIQQRAIDQFEQRLQSWAYKYYRKQSYIQNQITSQYDRRVEIPTSGNYAGWVFDNVAQYYQNIKVVIQDIHLYAVNSVATNISIFNSSTGDLLDQIPATLIAGEVNRVYIGKSYPSWKYPKLFIAYDESEVQTLKSDELWFGGITLTQGRIDKNAQIIDSNITGVGNTGQGMILTYNIDCSLDNWLCKRLDLFKTPYLYLLGYEFFQESLYSDRINRYTLLRRERAVEAANYFLDRFDKQMKGTLDPMNIDFTNDYCFECDRALNYRAMIP